MYLTSLPFDYTVHLGPGNRVRPKPDSAAGSRIRRGSARKP